MDVRFEDIDPLTHTLYELDIYMNEKSRASLTTLHKIVFFGQTSKVFAYFDEVDNSRERMNPEDCFGLTPLHYAILLSNIEMIEVLIQSGASISKQVKATELGTKIINGILEAEMRVIIDPAEKPQKKSDFRINSFYQGFTAIHFSVHSCRTDILKLVLRTLDESDNIKEVINAPSKDGFTPFLLSARMLFYPAAFLIFCTGYVDLDAVTHSRKLNGLHLLIINTPPLRSFYGENIRDFVPAGTKPSEFSLNPDLPKFISDFAKLLITHNKESLSSADKFGLTPFHLCASTGNYLLLEQCIQVAKTEHFQTNDISMLLNKKDTKAGLTSLHLAALKGFTLGGAKIVQLLLENGAAKTITDNKGRTPFNLFIKATQDCRWSCLQQKTIDSILKLLEAAEACD